MLHRPWPTSWIVSLGMLALAALACNLTSAPDLVAPPVIPSGTATTPFGPAALGTLTGYICYPSETIPPLTAYFQATDAATAYALPIAAGQASFSVALPPGEYVAFAWTQSSEPQVGGGYTAAVLCGLGTDCTEHQLLPFRVQSGETTRGIDLCDWYGAPGDVPAPPSALLTTAPGPADAPPGSVSLLCDGAYQRLRLDDSGANGRTLALEVWDANAWRPVWSLPGGDPMIRQIEGTAGVYDFGACQNLIVVPIRYSGSGADLEVRVLAFDGQTVHEVLAHYGTKGSWEQRGDELIFRQAKFLYGEPNCCPCATQTERYRWEGASFRQVGDDVQPTYDGTPPPECQP